MKRDILPRFDEQGLFLMAFCFALLVCIDGGLRLELVAAVSRPSGINLGFKGVVFSLLALALSFLGGLIATFHVFTSRKKSKIEKWMLLYFGVAISVVAGFNAAPLWFANGASWLVGFPIANIVASVLPFWAYRDSRVFENYILDDDTTVGQVCAGMLIVVVIIYYLSVNQGWHWAKVLSVGVFYSEFVDKIMRDVLSKSDNNTFEQKR